MTVSELIALLQSFPAYMTVKHQDGAKIEFGLYDVKARLSNPCDHTRDGDGEHCVVLESL